MDDTHWKKEPLVSTPPMIATVPDNRWRAHLVSLAFWTLLVLSMSLSTVLTSRSEGENASWLLPLAWNVPQFYLWMLLAPGISWLSRRTAHVQWRQFLAIQIPTSVLVAASHTSAMLTIYWLLSPGNPAKQRSLQDAFHLEFIYQFHLGLIAYWVILAVARGFEARRHLRDEKLRNAQLLGELSQAQLHALRTQLQPHFLFNTLNAISALSLSDPPQARLMISRLSDLLRLSLEQSNAPCVSVRRELQFLDCYLAIHMIRFQDRLRVQMHIGEDVESAMMPHLILQPLVENALQHGLLPVRDGGTLRIVIERLGATLRLLVEDDGKGPPSVIREGIGLGNTRARLAAFGSSSLNVRARRGGGTVVEVSLPYKTAISP
jgi:two-component system, LytTR family, sensor kinase